MRRLDKLRKPLLEMSPEELSGLISKIRIDRQIRKETVTKRKEKAAKSGKAKTKAVGILEALTPQEIAMLLMELGDDKGRQLPNGSETARPIEPTK